MHCSKEKTYHLGSTCLPPKHLPGGTGSIVHFESFYQHFYWRPDAFWDLATTSAKISEVL